MSVNDNFMIGALWLFFNSNYIYIFMALICVLYLIFSCYKEREEVLKCLLVYSILSILLIFNPIVYYFSKYFSIDNPWVFARFIMLFPFNYIIALAMGKIGFRVSGKIKKFLTILILLAIIVLTGETAYQYGAYIMPENIYKINNDAIEICDAIDQDAGDKNEIYVVTEGSIDGEKFIEGGGVYTGIRMYDYKIYFSADFPRLSGEVENPDTFMDSWSLQNQADYIIVKDNQMLINYFLDKNFKQIILSDEGYYVFKL